MQDKNARYDRQLRIWEKEGQTKLENSHLLILGRDLTLFEAIKNLVLPGIGNITWVYKLKYEVGFYDLNIIKIFNPSSDITVINENPKDYVNNLDKIEKNKYDLFIVSIQEGYFGREEVKKLASKISPKVRMLIYETVGFLGFMSIHSPPLPIVNPHPENFVDLRLDIEFLPLLNLIEEFKPLIENTDTPSFQRAQIPWLVLLQYYIGLWKSQTNKNFPSNKEEKEELKKLITKGSSLLDDPENYEEAEAAVNRYIRVSKLPSNLLKLMKDPQCVEANSESDTFWIILKAISLFIKNNNGSWPYSSAVPDMRSSTSNFIKIQNIYQKKSQEDILKVYDLIPSDSKDKIELSEVANFIKNFVHINLINFIPLDNAIDAFPSHDYSNDEDEDGRWWILALNIRAKFYHKNRRFPNLFDCEELIKFGKYKLPDRISHEISRLENACELPTTSAILGGLISQECLKVLTRHYTPTSDLIIWDGLNSKTYSIN